MNDTNRYSDSEKLLSEKEEEEAKGEEEGEKQGLSVWRQRLLVLSYLCTVFSALCADTFLFPFFPQKAKEKGLTDTQIGLVFSSFELSRFLSSFIVGYLTGKLHSKTLCVTGSMLITVCCITFGLVSYTPDGVFLPLCITTRVIAGAGTAMLAVTGLSIIMKATTYSTSTLGSMAEILQAIGYIGGTAIGAGLYQETDILSLYKSLFTGQYIPLVGYTPVFWIMGTVLALMNVLQMLTLPKLDIEPPAEKNVFSLLRIPGMLILTANCFALKLEGSARSTGISQYIRTAFHKTSSIVALLFSVWSAAYTVSIPVSNQILNKGYVFSYLMAAWPPTIIMVLLVGPSPLLNFIFHRKRYFLMTAGSVLISHIVRAPLYTAPYQASVNLAAVNGHKKDSLQTYGMITGLINCGFGLGAMTGPFIGGIVTDFSDFAWTMTSVALLQTVLYVTMVIYLVYMKWTKQPLAPTKIHVNEKQNSSHYTDDQDSSCNK